jgi:uncharacterized membrane protein YgaE (UPF0421/DUF939 family)
MAHHHFALTKFLLLIGVLISIFFAINYIKTKYQAYQAKQIYYQNIHKSEKILKEKKKEKRKEDTTQETNANEEVPKQEKEKKTQKKNKACSVYSEWEECEKK